MTEKHRSVNNVFWRVVAGRIKRGRGPDAARGPAVGHPWVSVYKYTHHWSQRSRTRSWTDQI